MQKRFSRHSIVVSGDLPDSDRGNRNNFPRIRSPVGILVPPYSQSDQFASRQPTVAVVVEKSQGFESILPHDPPGDRPEELDAGFHPAFSHGIPNQDSGLSIDPGPKPWNSIAVKIEPDLPVIR